MYPLKFEPILKQTLWGGDKIIPFKHLNSDLKGVGESWEISGVEDNESVVANGPDKGLTLADMVRKYREELVGEANYARFGNKFPLLIKFIDAKQDLSIQVHPTDELAKKRHNSMGKTEMWYIVDCEPGAYLYYGFQKEISKAEFKERIENNTLLEVLNKVPVHKGDVFFISAGTLHAIGKGILIAEIQQNSNTTYRIYDYGRVGADGKPRQLHVEKAQMVTRLAPPDREPKPQGQPERFPGGVRTLLSSCEYFTVTQISLSGKEEFSADHTSFHSLLMLEGEAVLSWSNGVMRITKGESVLVPANTGRYTLEGKGELVLTTI